MNCLTFLLGIVSAYLTLYILDDVSINMENTPALPFHVGLSRSVVSLPHRLSKDLVASSLDVVLQGGVKGLVDFAKEEGRGVVMWTTAHPFQAIGASSVVFYIVTTSMSFVVRLYYGTWNKIIRTTELVQLYRCVKRLYLSM